MIINVLEAPINLFFDVTPTGSIINRFSADLTKSEVALWLARFAMQTFFMVLSIIAVIAIAKWYLIIILPFMLGYLIFIFRFTIGAFRQLNRLGAVMKSPVLLHTSESISGNSTIRAFGK